MIEEIGTVIELRDRQNALVMCQKSTMCEHCASAGACSMGEDDDRSRVVEVVNTKGARVGDRVRIVTSTRSFLQSSFLLYIVPLIALVLGAVVGKLLGERFAFGIDPNLLSAVFGVFFMVGCFLIIRVGSMALVKEAYMPKIVEILPK